MEEVGPPSLRDPRVRRFVVLALAADVLILGALAFFLPVPDMVRYVLIGAAVASGVGAFALYTWGERQDERI